MSPRPALRSRHTPRLRGLASTAGVALGLAALATLPPRAASALSIAPTEIVFSAGGGTLAGRLSVLELTPTPPAGYVTTSCITDVCSPGPGGTIGAITLVMQLENTGADPIYALYLTPVPGNGSGPVRSGGYLAGGPEPDGLRDTGLLVGSFFPVFPHIATFLDDAGQLGGALLPGETSQPFFLSYSDLQIGDRVELEVTDDASLGSTTRTAIGELVVVPEPTAGLLGALGLSGLAAARRARTARAGRRHA